MKAKIQILLLAFAALLPWTMGFKASQPDLYGKPCTKVRDPDSTLAHCDLDKNMHCSEKGICECIVGERGRIFSHYHKMCVEVGSVENQYACIDDIQCTLSSYGRYSRCNRDYDRCECHDENEKTVLVDNICFVQKSAVHPSGKGLQGCRDDGNCQGSSLGNLSRCNGAEDTCECYDTRSNGKQDTALYNGRCVFKKRLGEYCNEDDECRAGFHKNAVCAKHDTYLEKEKLCQCPAGGGCDGSGAFSTQQGETKSIIVIGIATVIMGMIATKVCS